MNETPGRIDWYIFLSVTALMLFSIAFVYSASAPYAATKFGSKSVLFWRHSIRIFLAIVVMITAAKIDYRKWKKISKPSIIAVIILLVFTLLLGVKEKGAARWIDLGFIRFQPSELAKFALILHISTLLAKKGELIKDFKVGLAPILIWTGAVCLLIILQPNLSSALLILFSAVVLMFVGNANLGHMSLVSAAALGGSALLVALKSDYRLYRIMAFFGGEGGENIESYNYQLKQSLVALGNGGIFGLGPGLSRQSDLFLPESYGDFIFSIIGEEYGFVGALIIVCVYIFLIWRGMIIAKHAPDPFGYFLSIGIVAALSLNAFINLGVNTGLLPTTGMPLPFVSYGGTAAVFQAGAIGVLLNISSKTGIYPKEKSFIQ